MYEETVCLPAGTYEPFACGFAYPSEVSWSIPGACSGGGTQNCYQEEFSCSYGDQETTFTVVADAGECEEFVVHMSDSYGDGW